MTNDVAAKVIMSERVKIRYELHLYSFDITGRSKFHSVENVDDPVEALQHIYKEFKEHHGFIWGKRGRKQGAAIDHIRCVDEYGHEQWRLQIS